MARPPASTGELIVVGAGIAGLSAAWAASSLGFTVTCLEARYVGHPAASSAGLVKILRYAYEDEQYARMMVDAEERWRRLANANGSRLVSRCYNLNVDRASSPQLASLVRSLEVVSRRYELLLPGSPRLDEIGIMLFPGEEAVLELEAGVVEPGRALAMLSNTVRKAGVEVVEGEHVTRLTTRAAGVRVNTSTRHLDADRVIVAVGPWVHDLIPSPPWPLRITAQHQLIFATDRPIGNGQPTAWAELVLDDGYGVVNGPSGRHVVGGHATRSGQVGPESSGPESSGPDELVHDHLAAFQRRLTGGRQIKIIGARSCRYTTTADASFLISECADLPGVVLLSACSGHGFKFALATGYQAAVLAAS